MNMEEKSIKIILLLLLLFVNLLISCPPTTTGEFNPPPEILTRTTYPDKDAYISNQFWEGFDSADNNMGAYPKMMAIGWTSGGIPYTGKSLIQCNLTNIPDTAIIQSAYLYLYGVDHNPLTLSNAAYLQRITEPWSETSVTWNNQPSTTSSEQISIPQLTGSQDYTADITNLYQKWGNHTYENYGLMLSLQNAGYYAWLDFASSDNTITSKRPKLVVTYYIP